MVKRTVFRGGSLAALCLALLACPGNSPGDAASNANLQQLSIVGGTLVPSFNAMIVNYSATVPGSAETATIAFATAIAQATCAFEVDDEPVDSLVGIPLRVGSTTVAIAVTSSDGSTTRTYKVAIRRPQASAANDATLAQIRAGSQSIQVEPGVSAYSAEVINAVSSVQVSVVPTSTAVSLVVMGGTSVGDYADGGTTVYGDKEVALEVGPNVLSILVVAGDGATERSYTLTVTRRSNVASADASLAAIGLSAGVLSPDFSPDQESYEVEVGNARDTIALSPQASDGTASVAATKDGGPYAIGSYAALAVGENVFRFVVTAPNGTTKRTYTVAVTREQAAASSDASLASLALSGGVKLTPAFDPTISDYGATVSNATEAIALSAVKNSSVAAMTGAFNGSAYALGSSQALAVGAGNVFSVTVTAQDTTTRTYTVTVTRAAEEASSDASLGSLTVSQGVLSPAFAAGTFSYGVSVANAVGSIRLVALAADDDATVSLTKDGGNYANDQDASLSVGANVFQIAVTAEDGSTEIYTVTVTRAVSSNALLASLSTSAGSIAFSAATTGYTVNVPYATASASISAAAQDPLATVAATLGAAPITLAASVALAVGTNTFAVTVQAPDGITFKVYTVRVIRATSTDATLASIVTSAGEWSVPFAPATVAYTVSVPHETASMTLDAEAAVAEATVAATFKGAAYALGATAALAVGSNAFVITVRAVDASTTKQYTVTVVRAASANADLASITPSSGSLSPPFAAGTTSYSLTLPNATSSISLAWQLADAGAGATATAGGAAYAAGAAKPLVAGTPIPFVISVTAASGAANQYTVTVTRLAEGTAAVDVGVSLDARTDDLVFENDGGTLAADGTWEVTASIAGATAFSWYLDDPLCANGASGSAATYVLKGAELAATNHSLGLKATVGSLQYYGVMAFAVTPAAPTTAPLEVDFAFDALEGDIAIAAPTSILSAGRSYRFEIAGLPAGGTVSWFLDDPLSAAYAAGAACELAAADLAAGPHTMTAKATVGALAYSASFCFDVAAGSGSLNVFAALGEGGEPRFVFPDGDTTLGPGETWDIVPLFEPGAAFEWFMDGDSLGVGSTVTLTSGYLAGRGYPYGPGHSLILKATLADVTYSYQTYFTLANQ